MKSIKQFLIIKKTLEKIIKNGLLKSFSPLRLSKKNVLIDYSG